MAQDNDFDIDLHRDISSKYLEELQKALAESDKPEGKSQQKDE
ncbi:MAG: hypothetical protein QFB86_04580 [Patescibacteria group bacterium]|nr:hypothetical protein [Patescibacteria group bacterium]